MASTKRPVPAAASATPKLISDDPVENASLWLSANAKPLAIAGALALAAGLGVWGVRASDAKKRANASTALYEAQALTFAGQADSARIALEAVASRYKGTTAGEQAVLLVAQNLFDAGKHSEGVVRLEAAKSGASRAFAAPIEALMAAGYEAQGNFAKAAEHYAAAAKVAANEVERGAYKLAEARQLMAAGKRAEAIAAFEALRGMQDTPYATEASVRIGELTAQPGS
jgi:predicted negative regulator of RcsB-dependent stress response